MCDAPYNKTKSLGLQKYTAQVMYVCSFIPLNDLKRAFRYQLLWVTDVSLFTQGCWSGWNVPAKQPWIWLLHGKQMGYVL